MRKKKLALKFNNYNASKDKTTYNLQCIKNQKMQKNVNFQGRNDL